MVLQQKPAAFTAERRQVAPNAAGVRVKQPRFPHRFKVFADYEDYIKCQEGVNALYKVGG